MKARVERTREELLKRLEEHCAVLEDYHRKACVEGDARYLGEIAGKLRVLAYESRSNRPLLLHLMSEFGLDVPITIDKPRDPIVMSLPEHLAGLVCAIRIPSGDLAELSRSDLIALWSQQSGAAHEDWALDQRLATIFRGGLFVGGQPVEARALCVICRTVLLVARGFLAKIAELRMCNRKDR